MPRSRPADRFQLLLDAAVRVFIARGFRRTQMSDIAHAAKVSQGTLYNYFESKEALFYLILDRAFTEPPAPEASDFPIATQNFDIFFARLRDRLLNDLRLRELDRALTRRKVEDARGELEAVLREYYDMVARLRRGFDLIERSAIDIPEFGRLIYVERRRLIIDRLTRYLESRIAMGHIRPLPSPATAARFILETIVWFARHRHNTPDSSMITDEAAFATTTDLLLHGLLLDPAGSARRKPPKERSSLRAGRRLR
jgi:AcrR family transcriptional regulator